MSVSLEIARDGGLPGSKLSERLHLQSNSYWVKIKYLYSNPEVSLFRGLPLTHVCAGEHFPHRWRDSLRLSVPVAGKQDSAVAREPGTGRIFRSRVPVTQTATVIQINV
ncbi:MAG: hypothetical protein A07HR60_02012 [uncultured archaeon A07HR60]|nr:MAG: hypothetical protein A07HR60_02012 [uncultured archaeon A07HR60]